MDFPKPKCPLCSRWASCKSLGNTDPSYPDCARPLLATSVKRTGQLLDALFGHDKLSPLFKKTLLKWFGRHHETYSEVFEPSMSMDSHGLHLSRFSYAFPGFRDEAEMVLRELKSLAHELGKGPEDAVHRLEKALCDPVVTQPIIGLAWDSVRSWRFKLYLQFAPKQSANPLKMAQAILGDTRLMNIFQGKSLRLLGMDLGPDGMIGAKLYFHYPYGELIEPGRWSVNKDHLLSWMAGKGLGPPKDALIIHRLTEPGDTTLQAPAELDFSLPETGVLLDVLQGQADVKDLFAFPEVRRIWRDFSLAARRISVSLKGRHKLNLYYVLTEME